jgi:hypothetical protein
MGPLVDVEHRRISAADRATLGTVQGLVRETPARALPYNLMR